MSIRSVLTLRRLAAPLTCATLALAGCGSDSTTKADVPSLNGSDASSEATTTTTIDPEEAAQNFVACLREQGIEVADPKVDSDGQIDMRSIFDSAGINPGDDSMRTAMDSCRDELANAGFGPSEEDSEARQEAMLAFTSCLRDEGLDVGDITFDGPGQGGPPSGAAGASGSDASGATFHRSRSESVRLEVSIPGTPSTGSPAAGCRRTARRPTTRRPAEPPRTSPSSGAAWP